MLRSSGLGSPSELIPCAEVNRQTRRDLPSDLAERVEVMLPCLKTRITESLPPRREGIPEFNA